MGLGATPSILYAAICHLRQQENRNPPSLRWFQPWLKKNPVLHSIKTKPITQVHVRTHSEEDLKSFFLDYQNTLSKYGIQQAKYVFNMDECDVRIGCSTGEIVVVPTEVKELYTASPENRKSLTIIETICVDGSTPPPPIVICPGEKIMENCIQDNLSGGEVIAVALHQQKDDLRRADATRVRTDCVRPMPPVRPDRPPDVFSHPMRLVRPNALIPHPMHPARLLRPPSVPTPPSSFPSSTALV